MQWLIESHPIGVPTDLRPPDGLRIELLNALFSDFLLLLGHALEGHLSVLVHVDVELVKEVFGLDIGPILVHDVGVLLRLSLGGVGVEILVVAVF